MVHFLTSFVGHGIKWSGSFSDSTPKKLCPTRMHSTSADNDVTWDLGAVADVCVRFIRNAKACFAHSKKDDFDVFCVDVAKLGMTNINQMMVKTAKCLRNFGEFIIKIKAVLNNGFSLKYPRVIIELLARYPS